MSDDLSAAASSRDDNGKEPIELSQLLLDDERRTAFLANDLNVYQVVDDIESEDTETAISATNVLVALSCGSQKNQLLLIESGVLSLIPPLLESCDDVIVERLVSVFSLLSSKFEPCQLSLLLSFDISLLLDCACRDDHIGECAAWALSSFALSSADVARTFVSAGGVDILAHVVRDGCNEAKRIALGALTSLFSTSLAIRDFVIDSDSLESVISTLSALSEPTDSENLVEFVFFLRMILSASDSARHRAIEAGILQAIEPFHQAIPDSIASLLFDLSLGSNEVRSSIAASIPSVAFLVDTLRSRSELTVGYAVSTVSLIALAGDAARVSILEAGFVPLGIALLSHPSEQVVSKAAAALAVMALGPEEVRTAILALTAHIPIAERLANPPRTNEGKIDESSVENLCDAIEVLSCDDDLVKLEIARTPGLLDGVASAIALGGLAADAAVSAAYELANAAPSEVMELMKHSRLVESILNFQSPSDCCQEKIQSLKSLLTGN